MTVHLPQSRLLRTVLFFGFTICIILVSTVQLHAEPKRDLYHNDDATEFFKNQDIPQGKAGETIDRYIDVMAEAGVTVFLCNTNFRRTNYRSDVWDSYWDGYDPQGPDDQPFLAPVPRSKVKHYRHKVHSMLAVHREGIDFPARIIKRCRFRGISPWISLRMNDCHYNRIPTHPAHGSFWKDNPQFKRQNCREYYATCLDYARPQVRDYFMALIDETLERYDIDGLELDFMRDPYLFSTGKEAEGALILTEWMREVRRKVDVAAARRGHSIKIGARGPSRPQTASNLGLQVVDWARIGIIDLLVVTPRWTTLEFDMPMEQWRRLLAGSKTKLAGGLEMHYRPCRRNVRTTVVTPEIAAGAAVSVLSRGADAVYLFNYFQNGALGWSPHVYQKHLNAMSSLDTLLEMPRRVCITFRDITTPGENYRSPLPATGNKIAFPLKLGPVTEKNGHCELLVGLNTSKNSSLPIPTATVNGKACRVLNDKPSGSERRITFSVPRVALKPKGAQKIEITAKGADPLTIRRLEMSLDAAKK